MGTGDGRAVVARAAASPRDLVIGLDANASAMAEASRRADRSGPGNAIFVVAAAESPPAELVGRADVVSVTFPWGSLLRGVLGHDDAVLVGLASLLCAGGDLEVITSVEPRDGAPIDHLDAATVEAIHRAWSHHGLALIDTRPARPDELAVTRSSWARRLAADPSRRMWRLRGRRAATIRGT